MSRYLKLVHIEIQRFWKLYVVLFIMTLFIQGLGIFLKARDYLSFRSLSIEMEGLSEAEFVLRNGRFYFLRALRDIESWMMVPIELSAAALLIYTVFIWYRDWIGKNSFIYRLLMIPTARRNIYFAKMTTIILLVLGLIAFQIMILPIEKFMFDQMIPKGLNESIRVLDVLHLYSIFPVLVPTNFVDFLLVYGIGLSLVSVIFTVILLERSFRLKGFVAGIVYLALVGFMLFLPLFFRMNQFRSLYPAEIIMIELVEVFIIGLLSVWLSLYLMKNKVTV